MSRVWYRANSYQGNGMLQMKGSFNYLTCKSRIEHFLVGVFTSGTPHLPLFFDNFEEFSFALHCTKLVNIFTGLKVKFDPSLLHSKCVHLEITLTFDPVKGMSVEDIFLFHPLSSSSSSSRVT